MSNYNKIVENHKALCGKIMENRYLIPDKENCWEDIVKRIDGVMGDYIDVEFINDKRFIPGGRILSSLGAKNVYRKDASEMLFNCFILKVEDNIKDIGYKLALSLEIFQQGGGIGYVFDLRPKGNEVKRSRGKSSGIMSFIELYGKAIGTIRQGGGRRGAGIVCFDISHPDVMDFINAKKKFTIGSGWENFNTSVSITKEFKDAVINNGFYSLRWNGKDYKKVSAREVLYKMSETAWECGDPGIFHLANAQQRDKTIIGSNPCGEVTLGNWEVCCLGSLVLPKYFKSNDIDYALLENDIRSATRFLDRVIDISDYPHPKMKEITQKNRRLGLGTIGIGNLFNKFGYKYGSLASLKLTEGIFHFINEVAEDESIKMGNGKRKNIALTTQAPTGTTSFVASLDYDGMLTTGIEPVFDHFYDKWITIDGNIEKKSILSIEFMDKLKVLSDEGKTNFTKRDLFELKSDTGYEVASDISPSRHLDVQESAQKYVENSISKTINLPESATINDVYDIYERVVAGNVIKGTTIWRDNCRTGNLVKLENEECSTKK